MAFKFPSLDFFRELARRMNADRAAFEKLGFCDAVMGVRVLGPTPHLYALTFEVFECSDIREIGDAREADLDFTLEAPPELWRAMLDSIREHGRPAPEYTLNSLSHLGNRMRVVYDDPEGHDKLYRFMATLQAYFDNARDLEIEWA